ncbi:hypothetical protein C0991_000823, partial [Blastosporella zonata]
MTQPAGPAEGDNMPLALCRTPRNARPTPALVAACEAAMIELVAWDAEEDWALEGTLPEALTVRRSPDVHTFLASIK